MFAFKRPDLLSEILQIRISYTLSVTTLDKFITAEESPVITTGNMFYSKIF